MADRSTGAEATRRALARLSGLAVPVTSPDAQVEGQGERLSAVFRADEGRGSWVPAHGPDPSAEARAIVDEALAGRAMPPIAVVFGIGGGHVIDDVFRRAPATRVLAVELAPELLPAFAVRRDWTPWLESRQLVVTAVPRVWPDLSAWPDADFLDGPLAIVVTSIAQHRVRALSEAWAAWRQVAFERRANAEARRTFAAPYVRHTLANVPHVVAEGDVAALDGIAGETPIVICAAGPSLDRVAADVARQRERVFVLAADTTVRPLLHAGVEPDLVVAIDPTTLNGRHLLDLPRLRASYLVAEPSLDPRAVHPFAGRTFFGRIGRFHPWPWLETQGVSCGNVEVWGSVLTAACTLAQRLGTGPIVFAGTDLAYSGGQPYCRHTTFEADWDAQATRDGISVEEVWRRRLPVNGLEEIDVNGQPVRTAPHLVAFRNWVRAFVARHPTYAFVNVSGSGILHGNGIAAASLDSVVAHVDAHGGFGDRLATAHAARPAPPAALASALRALGGTADDAAPLAEWLASAPGLDAGAIRREAAAVAARTAHVVERFIEADATQDTTTMPSAPEWIDVPHDPATFIARAPMAWEVPESAVRTYAYVRNGKTLTLSFTITGSTLHGGGVNELYLRIPDHFVAARSCVNAIWVGSANYREAGYARTHAGLDVVVLFRASEAPFGPDPGGFSVFGQITFEVQ
ncbi:motility associated factor glycosyltransferase family protein [Luteitalea sp.]|jgi:hypothetical protein|uniref:motility associated factor glycosyltransferase family protein n=1 Tax=Luteitalea sp. TaxID=2004800 RepID=UPI0037C960A4